MITEWILQLFTGLVLGFVSLAPEVDASSVEQWEGSVTNMWAAIWYAENWLPIHAMIIVMLFALAMRVTIFLYAGFTHLWRLLPFT